MFAVDTNILVRLVTGDDPSQVPLAQDFISNGAWVSLLVLAETMWVLVSGYSRKPAAIASAVDMLLNHRELVLQDPDVVAAALEHFRSKSGLGFSECLVLEIARKAGHLPLGTFDRKLSKLSGTQLV
jgi:predicted nucleic-acid-binding protein